MIPFRRLILLSLAGHAVVLLIIFGLGFVRFRPSPSTEILHLQSVRMVERQAPPATVAEPDPTPTPPAPVVPEPLPPPPPPPPEPQRVVEPVPPPPVRVTPPPPPPERTISPEPNPEQVRERERREQQRREWEAEQERRRQEAERLQRERDELRRLQEEERQRQQQLAQVPPPPVTPPADQAVAIEEGSELGNFAASLVASISRHWLQQRRWANLDLRVRISMTILRSGEFRDIRIVTPSGDLDYDAAALEALTDYPYGPPLPAHIVGDSIEVTVVLVPR